MAMRKSCCLATIKNQYPPNMNVTGTEFFDDLIEIQKEQNSIIDKYPKMRSLLERVCKDLTVNENIQFSNLFSRLNYVCEKTNLGKRKTFQLNTLRINANNVLHADFKPTQEDYLQNLKALCNALNHFYSIEIPNELSTVLPRTDYYRPRQRQGKKTVFWRYSYFNFTRRAMCNKLSKRTGLQRTRQSSFTT
jgi:hypothetical protein